MSRAAPYGSPPDVRIRALSIIDANGCWISNQRKETGQSAEKKQAGDAVSCPSAVPGAFFVICATLVVVTLVWVAVQEIAKRRRRNA